jgi:hypothetical protein
MWLEGHTDRKTNLPWVVGQMSVYADMWMEGQTDRQLSGWKDR